jgi:protein-S-isoprenylcysteine O-methyltransferase Ste14
MPDMSDRFAALIAGVTYLLGAGIGIGWRMWWQWRQTGSTGFKGVSGRVGSADWFGGVGFILGVAVTAAAPIPQLLGIVSPLWHLPWLSWSGVVIAVVGISAVVYAQLAMGASWRIGVDADETTTLVRSGVFGVVRNPIYAAMFVFWLGTTLIAPNIVAIPGYVLLVLSIELQVRLVEEPYLLQVHGDAYREYASTVGRFAPHTGLMR